LSNISLKEMAALLDVSEEHLKQSMITLGIGVLQSEAERIQGVESWEENKVAETFHLRGKPEIKHFRQALENLTGV
jgi:hypothetical protein